MRLIKTTCMFSNYLLGLTSISQWALFLGVSSILFGLVEKRERFVLSGHLGFLLLGILALWIILTDEVLVPNITDGQIPKQLKVLVYFKGVVLFTGVNVVSLLLRWFKFRFYKVSLYVLIIFALTLFFMVFNIQQMAN